LFLAQRDHNNRLMLKLTVVVVSYNVISLLRDCLESVAVSAAASADWLAVEVVVVDNASGDGSPAMVAAGGGLSPRASDRLRRKFGLYRRQ